MRYLRGFLVFLGISLLLSGAVYLWFPGLRRYIRREDSLVESLSAVLFLFACLWAVSLLVRRNSHRRLLILISIWGLLAFLSELSFGERIFGLSMPWLAGVKLDGIHDLFALGYAVLFVRPHSNVLYAAILAGIVVVLVGVCVRYRFRLMDTLSKVLHSPSYLLLVISAALILAAILLDLELTRSRALSMLEEVLEMNAGLALLLSALSLTDAGRAAESN
jgi:hypothetical protein